MKINEKYVGEQWKISVEQTKLTTATYPEKIRDIQNWNEVQNLIKTTVFENDVPVDFVLWNSGFSNGITIASEQENIFIFNKCDFKIVRDLFIQEMVKENIDKLTIVRTKSKYQATYKTSGVVMIKNYIYEPCDSNNLSNFLERVADLAVPEKDHSDINGGLAFVSNRGLSGNKGFAKHKGNRKRTYRNIIK